MPEEWTTVFRGPREEATHLQLELGALGFETLVVEPHEGVGSGSELRVPAALERRSGERIHGLVRALRAERDAELQHEADRPREAVAQTEHLGKAVCFLFTTGIGMPLAALLGVAYAAHARALPERPAHHRFTMVSFWISALITAAALVLLLRRPS